MCGLIEVMSGLIADSRGTVWSSLRS